MRRILLLLIPVAVLAYSALPARPSPPRGWNNGDLRSLTGVAGRHVEVVVESKLPRP